MSRWGPGAQGEARIGGVEESLRQRAAVVALRRLPKISWPGTAATILERGDALSVLDEETTDRSDLFTTQVPLDRLIEAAAADLARWEATGVGVHSCLDD